MNKKIFLILIFIISLILAYFWYQNEKWKTELIKDTNLKIQKDSEEFKKILKRIKEEKYQKFQAKILNFKQENCLVLKNKNENIWFQDFNFDKNNFEKYKNIECSFTKQKHLTFRKKIKAIYLNAYQASSEKRINSYVELAKNTDINAFIIDIKEVDGKISFEIPEVLKNPKYNFISDDLIKDPISLIKKLHQNNIYLIARIVVFKDNYLTKTNPKLAIKSKSGKVWRDYKGFSYLNPENKYVWDRIIYLAKVSSYLGFDEINFDYIRFPSDGNINEMDFKNKKDKWWRTKIIDSFFNYLSQELKKENIKISADIFGYTIVVDNNDLKLGQVFEDALLYFDRISPMIYPSHYRSGFKNILYPNDEPYQTIKENAKIMSKRIEKLNWKIKNSKTDEIEILKGLKIKIKNKKIISKDKVVPWIQFFDCPWCLGQKIHYSKKEILEQEKGLKEFGFNSWFGWNPSSRYCFYK